MRTQEKRYYILNSRYDEVNIIRKRLRFKIYLGKPSLEGLRRHGNAGSAVKQHDKSWVASDFWRQATSNKCNLKENACTAIGTIMTSDKAIFE